MSTFNTARLKIGDRVRLAKVHHSHSDSIKARKGQWGTITDKGEDPGFRRCLVLFDGDEMGFMIANRYLEPLEGE